MGQKEKPKTARQRKELPRQTVTTKPDDTPANVSRARDPVQIFRNDCGELEILEGWLFKSSDLPGPEYANRAGQHIVGQRSLGRNSGRYFRTPGKCGTPEALNVALESVAALAPRDGLEVMLCSQLVALHSQGMDFLRRGMLAEQTSDGLDRNVNRATKLLRTFATMAECLRTHRGGGQQKVTVEHVTVQAGGQAIVGTVNPAVGGGDAQRNRE